MTLSFTILGCGSSMGVPRIALGWGACDPANPKNRRRRTSLLVERRNAFMGLAGLENGVTRLSATVLGENAPMRAVLNKADATWAYDEPGVVTTVVPVPSPDGLIRDLETVQRLCDATRQVMAAASVALA